MKYSLLKNKETGIRSIRINKTGEKISENDNPVEYSRLRKLALNNLNKANFNDAMKSVGLTRVIGAVSGKVYWE
jgi:hypothetical protein